MTVPKHVFETYKAEDLLQIFGSGKIVVGTTDGTANTESLHDHGLGRIPRGFLIISQDKAGSIYDSAAHTSTQLKLKCSVATVAFKAWVF